MNGKIMAIVAVVIIAVAGVGIGLSMNGGDGGKDTGVAESTKNDVTVYLLNNGNTTPYTTAADTTQQALENIFSSISVSPSGLVENVNGELPGKDQSWTVWNWSPVDGWVMINLNKVKQTNDSMTLAVMLSDSKTVDGYTEYSSPGFDVMTDVYFFIQFREQYNENSYVTSYLTESQRKEGVWVRGTGADAADALADVATRLGWDLDMSKDTGDKGWLYSFFGLSDIRNPDGTYTYWSQYQWVDGEWEYNDNTLGGCELSDSPYFALIRQTTEVKGSGSALTVTPEDMPSGL